MTLSVEEKSTLAEVARSACDDLDAALSIRDIEARRAALRALFDANISWMRRRCLVEAAIETLIIGGARK